MAPDPRFLVDVQNVTVRFPRKRSLAAMIRNEPSTFRAVAEADLTVSRGEVVGLVGESGSGKTTLGRTVLRLYEPDDGAIVFDGDDITHTREHNLRDVRRRMALVFQDPLSSLNPRHTIHASLAIPLRISTRLAARDIDERAGAALRRVGLPLDARNRYPHELSGGQLQRVALARALMLNPALVVADEAVSKLDVSIRSQILNLFKDLREEFAISFLFITHDLHVANYISDRVAVMFFGRIVECAPAKELFRAPRHPYTRALLATIDDVEQDSDAGAPRRCRSGRARMHYQSRCPRRIARCGEAHPLTTMVAPDHTLACHHPF